MSDPDSTPATSANTNSRQLWPCDIVMAGGVTSGIVYPGAVAKIAEDYSFHSIGGTSVGAIAAIGAAAAEYRRRKEGSFEGFARLASLHTELGMERAGHTRLFHLFTPESGGEGKPDTRGLFALLLLFSGAAATRKLKDIVLFALAQPFIAGWVLAVLTFTNATVAWLLYKGEPVAALLVMLSSLALAFCAGLAAFVWLLMRRWLPAFRNNNYGICTGNADPSFGAARDGSKPFQGLTPWIHGLVQDIAGRANDSNPLTFGDLWNAPLPDGSAKPRDGGRSIELAMITSDISRNRLAQLPFLEWPSSLYIAEDTLARCFPPAVVTWMRENQGEREADVALSDKIYRLPRPENLPVVFAARLSLSFPVLLSAMPLLTPNYGEKDERGRIPLRQVWFSDGGLISNFPIHFFDSPIPSRPTFCLNLVGYNSAVTNEPTRQAQFDGRTDGALMAVRRQAAHEAASRDADKPISKPRSPRRATLLVDAAVDADPQPNSEVWGMIAMARRNEMAPVPFVGLDGKDSLGLVPFVVSLFNTSRHWSDNQMLYAPGTRDRVVHVGLRQSEGGLNLDMPAATIADLAYRGRAAGMLIAARFNPGAVADPETGKPVDPAFPNHRWVRYRNFMAAFEKVAERFRLARTRCDEEAAKRREPTIDDMIDGNADDAIGYPVPAKARPFFKAATAELKTLSDSLRERREKNPADTFDAQPTPANASPPGAAPRPKIRAVFRPLADDDPLA